MSDPDSLVYNAVAGASAYFAVGGTNNTVTDQRSFDTDALDASLAAVNSGLSNTDSQLQLAIAAKNVTTARLALVETMKGIKTLSDASMAEAEDEEVAAEGEEEKKKDKKEKTKNGFKEKLSAMMIQDYLYSRGVPGYADCSGQLKANHAKLHFDNLFGEVSQVINSGFEPVMMHIFTMTPAMGGNAEAGKLAAVETLNETLAEAKIDLSFASWDAFVSSYIDPIIGTTDKFMESYKGLIDSNALKSTLDSSFTDFSGVFVQKDNLVTGEEADWYWIFLQATIPVVMTRYKETFDPSYTKFVDSSGDKIDPIVTSQVDISNDQVVAAGTAGAETVISAGLPVLVYALIVIFGMSENDDTAADKALFKNIVKDVIEAFGLLINFEDPTQINLDDLYNIHIDISGGVHYFGSGANAKTIDVIETALKTHVQNPMSNINLGFARMAEIFMAGEMEDALEEGALLTAKTNYLAAVAAHNALL